ncbi:translesion error-prone DNA polymerase V subunit UmuC (plasmid) [Moellerella wisconsensis]|uniref:translesion error-prone DNA polymerase V subunit UmuC n=1 Tax=Moellerella wisconsensis TaxID=158849 RepID=UPI001F4EB5B5|nr:translesion error-prone DNA polymerase V subunit UmuC [Moellerella wisconsensis]UNH29207.1 translesion error-prone DNA polymerase V subunit UmuC [Moellerella wisconsensis]
MFSLIDVNSFYASCERIFRPDLANKPIIVLSNNDGCVIARSREVKKIGIKMGALFFEIKHLIKQYDIQVFSSNYTLYADISNRVMDTLSTFSPRVETYSIDEQFLDMAGMDRNFPLEDYGRLIQKRVLQIAHVPVGVGFAQTKTLAKLANHAAKTWTKTGGVVDLSNTTRQRKLMSLLPVNEVWGIGRKISKRLNTMGIITALDLANAETTMIRKVFGVVVERTVRELNGESCIELEEVQKTKEQIICSRSFGKKIEHYDNMHQAVCDYAERAAEKLRQEKQLCSIVSTFIQTSYYSQGDQYYNHHSERLEYSSADTRDIINAAVRALNKIWKSGVKYHKAGIMLSDFSDSSVTQLNLFSENKPYKASEQLMKTLDQLNNGGIGKVWFAGKGIDTSWRMKRKMLSPAYTTSITELPIVKI